MKKILNILLFLLFTFLVGCEVASPQPSYKVDLTLVSEEMYIEEFDVSLIRIRYTDVDGKITFISCNETMFTEADYKKLHTVGTHTVTVIYKFLQEEITITLKTNSKEIYELDITLLENEMFIEEFDISLIRIKQTNEAGEVVYIPCDKTMLSEADYKKLSTVGTHTITVIYKLLEEQVTITLKRNESLTFERDLKVYFINVGQADSIFIMLPNGKNLLIDAGLDHATSFDENDFPSWENIKAVLESENIKTIDYVIVTHNHSDHYYYISDILRQYNVSTIYMSGSTSTAYTYQNILQTIKALNIKAVEVCVGDMLINEGLLSLQVVTTKKENNPEDANFTSVGVKLIYNQKSFLFMGDAGSKTSEDGEYIALNSGIDLKSDVLKVGHHGSTYSSSAAFLNKVKPEYAIMTTSSITSTGHPHNAAVNRISKVTNNILQSKNDGTILFVSNGEELNVFTHVCELEEKTPITATVTEVLEIAKDLADQATLPDKYQITGIVSEITYAYSSQYQNISFRLSDGSKTILCYRAKGTDASKIKIGDTITLVGNIQNYHGEIEVINGVISKRVAGN